MFKQNGEWQCTCSNCTSECQGNCECCRYNGKCCSNTSCLDGYNCDKQNCRHDKISCPGTGNCLWYFPANGTYACDLCKVGCLPS